MTQSWKDMADYCVAGMNLQAGWDSYKAPPPSLGAIANALGLLAAAKETNYRPDRVAYDVIGGITITYRCDDSRRATFVCSNSGQIHFLRTCQENEEILIEQVTDAADALKVAREYLE